MFFILSKTAAFVLLPSNLMIALGLAGLLLLVTRFNRAGIRCVIASLFLLALAGFSPLGAMLGQALESRFPPWDAGRGAPDGIVVLGGGIASQVSQAYGEPVVSSDAGRIVAIAKLARAYPNARIVYAGGEGSLFPKGTSEGQYLYLLLDSFGIPRERVTLETRSRNTYENAAFAKEVAQPKPGERWLLVTSAQHMPRAVGCFRRIGFPIEAYPVGWRMRAGGSALPGSVLSSGLRNLDAATHEWLGVVAYWLTGRTSELLPGPAL